MISTERFIEESDYLSKTKRVINSEKEIAMETLERIPYEYKGRYSDVKWGDEDLVEDLSKMYIKKIRNLENLEHNPYFGRFDFQIDDGTVNKYYIGKTDLRENNFQYILDWRNPICTLYYDHSLGKASYMAPKGKVNGNLLLKSQILIEDGLLSDVNDVDLVSQDELLRPYLNVNADNKMKTIIASIQEEQNEIIRRPLNDNMIIQGVAGSGKTSVALHRIAYLIYNYSNITKADNYLIIGPNKYFLDYISRILPDLDTDNVKQLTFEEIAKVIISNSKYTIENANDELNEMLQSKNDIALLKKIKGSLEYKDAIDKFMVDYFNEVIDKSIKFRDNVIFDETFFRENLTFGQNYYNKNKKFEKIFINRVRENWEDIYYKFNDKLVKVAKQYERYSSEQKKIYAELEKLRADLKSGYAKEIKQIIRPLNIDPILLYKKFLDRIEKYIDLDDEKVKMMKKNSLDKFRKKIIPYDDLAAVCYLSLRYMSSSDFKDIKQVTIDEAQDYNLFQYEILNTVFKNSNYSIFGDLAQSVYSYRAIDSWEDLNAKVFNGKLNIVNMQKSYRTTKEITLLANNILNKLKYPNAMPVIREGEAIEFVEHNDSLERIYINEIDDYKNKRYKSMGIICKSVEEMDEVSKLLDKNNIDYNYINSQDATYNGGICLLTSFLAKGLEFDKVIIDDASVLKYDENSKLDMHLLYVSCTRALHELKVLYNGKLCPVLNECLIQKKEDTKTLKKKI